ncbi:hypothetical protein COLO4_22228 [Corchorus olitorius]|uniref:Uncharacterized protein n=1 Tax=Corchorus olitorius TaxID=93759 RepID=A0A1R3INC3_9ROSI|nr:hypothetical protein COLO4_22228 [Corchorus olitorius]
MAMQSALPFITREGRPYKGAIVYLPYNCLNEVAPS